MKKFADYVVDIQKRVKDKRVLDIGCLATTEHNILLRHKEYRKYTKEMVGVDYNKDYLKMCEGEKNLYYLDITNTKEVNIFIEKFGTFSHIICTDIIEHIGNLTLFLDNVYKLLNKNGNLYITTPNALCPDLWCRSIDNDGNSKANPDHICFFDIRTLTALLNRSKLKVKEVMFQGVGDKNLKRLNLKLAPWMGKRIYIIATKE
jgi:2-polyprenyl-3-methyl-5-hydroxy-6-metoxy-1,4-benzoquinol methylase